MTRKTFFIENYLDLGKRFVRYLENLPKIVTLNSSYIFVLFIYSLIVKEFDFFWS